MKRVILSCLLTIAVGLGKPVHAQTSTDSTKLVQLGHQVFDSLAAGRFGPVHALFGPQMIAAVPTKEKLAELWASIVAQTGPLESLGQGEVRESQGVKAVIFPAKFANGTFNAIVAYAADGTIAGLAVRPSGS